MSTELAEGCLLALGSLPGIGPASLLALHRDLGAEEAWRSILEGRTDAHRALAEAVVRLERADATAHRRGPRGAARLVAAASALDPAAVRDRHLAAGLAVLVEGSAGFPTRLVDDPAPPAVVLVQGDPELLDAPSVAIVGTRNATRLGCETARHLAAALADLGLGVVSGLALGIDGASHRALVDGPPRSGAPVGVVATGLDRSYPTRHAGLQAAVAERGALVSEVPLGGGPTTWRFPARNRIIAALAEAVVIVESRATGGSMLTAAEAVARDRPVLAVPGHPTAPAAAGPLDLIADGAIPLRDVDDILVAIGRGGAAAGSARRARPGPAQVSEGGRAVLGALERGPSTFGELAGRVALPIEAVTLALAELEEAGLAAHRGMWIELTTSGSSQAVGP